MCSYNAVNGVPSCASKPLLNDRPAAMGFDGYTSDCGAVADVYSKHKYTNTTDATDVDVLTAGMDSDCGTFLGQNLQACIDDGTCDASVVNPPLTNLFKVQLRLGMFDSAASQPYTKLGMESVSTPAHQALALEAAQQGIVLLKNDGATLPLPKASPPTLAVLGPTANATDVMQGNYYGNAPFVVSVVAGLQKYTKSVAYVRAAPTSSARTTRLRRRGDDGEGGGGRRPRRRPQPGAGVRGPRPHRPCPAGEAGRAD